MFTAEPHLSWDQLEQRVRNVPLLQEREGEVIYPYLDATIELAQIPYAEVRPTSLYVVNANLDFQRRLAADLISGSAYDPLNLRGGLLVRGGSKPVGLIPPIVEETPEDGQYILDGMHRTYIGRQAGRVTFWGIHIMHIRPDCPAAALPNTWNEVVAYGTVPSDASKKRRYRPGNPLSMRRDFSALNGSRPRT